MPWYTTYNDAMNALKSGLESLTLDAYDHTKFRDVVFGPWEQLTDMPACHILESEPAKGVMGFGQSTMMQEIPIELHCFIQHPWKGRRKYPLTAREVVLQTISNVWDYFITKPGRTLTNTVQACVPDKISPWDHDKDWNVYHFIIYLNISVMTAPV